MASDNEILLPPGRVVWGSLYNGRDKNMEGKPYIDSNGKPYVKYEFGVAIPKTPGQHWATSTWGAKIWAIGHIRVPNAGQLAENYSWKVRDGDSDKITLQAPTPLKDRTGHAGHWIVSLGSSFAPKVYRIDPNTQKPTLWIEENAVLPGDWIEAYVNIVDNNNQQKPGVYLNHSMVCFVGYDAGGRISSGPDASAVGFGSAARPATVSATPLSALAPSAPSPTAPVTAPAPVVPPAVNGGAPTPPTVPASIEPPAPHTAILTPPGAIAPPPVAAPIPTAPPPVAARAMSAKANGATYEALIGAGWTDALLTQHGMFA
jgi:hypothetical protein